jgi:hypothetical protein
MEREGKEGDMKGKKRREERMAAGIERKKYGMELQLWEIQISNKQYIKEGRRLEDELKKSKKKG